jgi:MOSC domain-containing protein YiiM
VKIVSVNVGRTRTVDFLGRKVRSAIWKSPVTGAVRVTRLTLEGDKQTDLRFHGGPDKAVYAYPSEHYAHWARELPDVEFPWGAFGENFTTEGILDGDVRPGDRLEAGTAEFVVTSPRMPCYKLGVRFAREDMVRRFFDHGATGFYLSVLREGEVAAGDAIVITARADGGPTIAEVAAAKRERREARNG